MKTWFITGCSEGGIGAGIARAVLASGNRAVVTARSLSKIESIVRDYPETALPVILDVTSEESIQAAVHEAIEKFGSIDVLVNNAGYAYRSSVEEAVDQDMRAMYETNLFGPINLIKAVLPGMRERAAGTIINVSSIAAVRTGAASAYYASSKAALELLSDGLSKELSPLGIRVMIVEPGSFRTHFYDTSLKGSDMTISSYAETAWKRSVGNNVNPENQPGDPLKAGSVLVSFVENNEELPLRLLLGSDAVKVVRSSLQGRLAEIDANENISIQTDF